MKSRSLLLMAWLVLLAACSSPRAHANVRLTPNGVRVVPSLSTTVGGLGVTLSQ